MNFPAGGMEEPSFSLSHRDDYAFCAVIADPQVKTGVDLEKIEPREKHFLTDYFLPSEQLWVDSSPRNIRNLLTTLIWSAKESVLKALGVGLRWDTRQVEIGPPADSHFTSGEWHEIRVSTPSETHPWFAWWCQRDEYILTVSGFQYLETHIKLFEQNL